MLDFIIPNWQAPAQVKAYTTTRAGGHSQAPYDSFNLADHVGDDPEAVVANRALLRRTLQLPSEPLWLNQVHGTQVIEADMRNVGKEADASYAKTTGQVCVVLTADCLPLLLCNRQGDQVAAVHAGWRSLAAGIIDRVLQQFSTPVTELLAWLGPAISVNKFEVGEEVYEQFVQIDPQAATAFQTVDKNRWLADLYTLARQQLQARGVTQIEGGDFCTVTEKKRFYSYRRDQQTGRMATLIWLE